MSRIAFVLPDLSGGGGARVASVLCGQWICDGHEVHLITFETPGTESIYSLNACIVRHQIGAYLSPKGLVGFAANNALRVLRLRACLRKIEPDMVIAFDITSNIAAVPAAKWLGVPVLISERNHPAYHKLSAMRSNLRKLIYPKADRLCVQSEDIRCWFLETMALDAEIIPNPVAPTRAEDIASSAFPVLPGCRRLVSLGRLVPQKGYDRLIKAFAGLAERLPEWDLVIFGEGPARGDLETLISEANLEERIFMPGVTRSAATELVAADLFVSASRFEGFPNALVEALAAGLCVVATDCPGATGEILAGGRFGLLAPDDDTDALAEVLYRTMSDDALRAGFAARAKEAVLPLAPAAIAQNWVEAAESCFVSNKTIPVISL